MGQASSKPRDLGSDRGYRVANGNIAAVARSQRTIGNHSTIFVFGVIDVATYAGQITEAKVAAVGDVRFE
jgi:hypothetical protein